MELAALIGVVPLQRVIFKQHHIDAGGAALLVALLIVPGADPLVKQGLLLLHHIGKPGLDHLLIVLPHRVGGHSPGLVLQEAAQLHAVGLLDGPLFLCVVEPEVGFQRLHAQNLHMLQVEELIGVVGRVLGVNAVVHLIAVELAALIGVVALQRLILEEHHEHPCGVSLMVAPGIILGADPLLEQLLFLLHHIAEPGLDHVLIGVHGAVLFQPPGLILQESHLLILPPYHSLSAGTRRVRAASGLDALYYSKVSLFCL